MREGKGYHPACLQRFMKDSAKGSHASQYVAARLAISRAGIHCLACGLESSVVKANSDQSRHGVLSTMHARSDVAPSGERSVLLLGFRSSARLGGRSIPYQNDSSDLLRSLSFRRPGSSARRSDRLHAQLRTLPTKRLPSNCSAIVSTSSKYESSWQKPGGGASYSSSCCKRSTISAWMSRAV